MCVGHWELSAECCSPPGTCPSHTRTRLPALSLHGAGCKTASCGKQVALGLWLEVLSFLQKVSTYKCVRQDPDKPRAQLSTPICNQWQPSPPCRYIPVGSQELEVSPLEQALLR